MLSNKILDKARKLVEADLQDEVARIEKERDAARVAAIVTAATWRERVAALQRDLDDSVRQIGPVASEYERQRAEVERFRTDKLLPLQAAMYSASAALTSAELRRDVAETQEAAESRRTARLLAEAAGEC